MTGVPTDVCAKANSRRSWVLRSKMSAKVADCTGEQQSELSESATAELQHTAQSAIDVRKIGADELQQRIHTTERLFDCVQRPSSTGTIVSAPELQQDSCGRLPRLAQTFGAVVKTRSCNVVVVMDLEDQEDEQTDQRHLDQ